MFSVIVWKEMYYCGFSVEQGSLWCRTEEGCFWMEKHQLAPHLRILVELEKIPEKDLQVRKPLHAHL